MIPTLGLCAVIAGNPTKGWIGCGVNTSTSCMGRRTWTHTRPHGRLAYSTGSAVSSSLSISEVTLSDRALNILCLPIRAASDGPPHLTLCGRKCDIAANEIFTNWKGPQDASLSWHNRYINNAICYECAKLYPLQVLSGSAPYHDYGA
jgi:hypothetical protein